MTLFNNKLWQRTFVVVSIVVLLVLLFHVGKRGIADIYAYQARAYVESWVEKNNGLEKSQWDLAFNSLSKALELVPNHADYLEAMASLYQWQVLLFEHNQSEAIRTLQQSKLFYHRAIEQRPAWPYAWANYALAKHQLNEIDNRYINALQRAVALGAWEPEVQIVIAKATLPRWDELNKSLQQLVVDTTFRALHSFDSKEYVNVLKDYNKLSVLCIKLSRDEVINQACSNQQLR